MTDVVRLTVSYEERHEAKRLGCWWDPQARTWITNAHNLRAIQRWGPLPATLPGEDRHFGQGLFVDLVPASCWFTNARSCIDQRDWERIRRMVISRADYRCEICHTRRDPERGIRLEVHERWQFVDEAATQVLKRLICLCAACHLATHFGFAQIRGLETQARETLTRIRRESGIEVEQHIAHAFELWRERSQRTWTLDLGILTRAGIRVQPPPPADQRADVARQQVQDDRWRRLDF